MVSKQDLLKYGTLALILFFVFESFFPLLYSPSQQPNQPTPTPFSFDGSGKTTANVTRLEYLGYAECDPNKNADVVLTQLPITGGVNTAFYSASEALAVDFSANTSVEELADAVQQLCGSAFLRSALLDVSPVRLTSGNNTQVLSKQHLQSFAAQNGLPYLRGFVYPEAHIGSVVDVAVRGVISDNALRSLTIIEVPKLVKQPIATVQPVIKPADANDSNESLNAAVELPQTNQSENASAQQQQKDAISSQG